MARSVFAIVLVSLLLVFSGCDGADMGRGQIVPAQMKQTSVMKGAIEAPTETEIDLIETMALERANYRQGLVNLIDYYEQTGDYMKLTWARKELAAFDTMTQYSYIIEANVAGSEQRNLISIEAADKVYASARQLEDEARTLLVIVDENKLRLALAKYNELIRRSPNSDKVDDAAYHAAGIYEHFKDYSIALLYYKRVFQWNPDNEYPARYKAAYILDRKMLEKNEAVRLYKEALQKDNLVESYAEFAKERIEVMTAEGQLKE